MVWMSDARGSHHSETPPGVLVFRRATVPVGTDAWGALPCYYGADDPDGIRTKAEEPIRAPAIAHVSL